MLALAFASQTLFAEPVDEKMVPASPTLTDEGAQAIKKAFPNVTIGASKLNMDRGIEAWFVDVTGDPNVSSVEVAAGSAQIKGLPVMVLQSSLKLDVKNLPAAVSEAAGHAAGDGVKSATHALGAEKVQIFAEFKTKNGKPYDSEGANYQLVPLATPITAYDVTYERSDDHEKGVVRIGEDGKVINAMNWMMHAAADVPAGKLVIRANLGCVADYTDLSGVVWSADRMYPKKQGGKQTTEAQPAQKPGEIVWGGLGGEPHGGRQHTRTGLVIQGTDAPFIYDSERDKEGQFQFDVPNGKYTVRIHFCETWEGGKNKGARPFAIDLQGKTVVPSMEIAQDAGGWMKPLVKEFKDVEVTDGKLLISPHGNFGGNDKHASIEAYEVIQQ